MIKVTWERECPSIFEPATYTYFIDSNIIKGFSIEKKHKEDYYTVSMWGQDDSWDVGEFPSYECATEFIKRIGSQLSVDRMHIELITDVDKIREDIINGQN